MVRDGYGRCVKTGTWTPELAIVECHPELVKKAQPVAETQPEVKSVVTEPAIVEPLPAKPVVAALPTGTVFFAFDESILTAKAKGELDKVARSLNGRKYRSVTVFGYTDNIGTAKYNKKLSQRRADAVKKYLVERGVTSLETVAGGVLELKNEVCASTKRTDLIACYWQDRRANIVVH